MDVYVVKNIVDRAIELGYIIPGYRIEDYVYKAVEEYGFLSIMIIGPVGSGKSNLALQLAYYAYRDWNVALSRLVMSRREFLELLNKGKRIPLIIGDDIGAWLPRTLYFTDRKAWEYMRKIWEMVRTNVNVFIATAPTREDVVSFIADKSDMLIIMHKRLGYVGRCEVQRRVFLQDYERDKEFRRLVLIEELEFPLKPGIKARDADRFPGIPEHIWEKYWKRRVSKANTASKEALEYELKGSGEEVVVKKMEPRIDVSKSTYRFTIYRIERVNGTVVRKPIAKVILPRNRKYRVKIVSSQR